MRSHDWSRSPLGPVEGWSEVLRGAVSLMLPAQAQIVMFWGPEFVALYNDAYAPTIGEKHPHALGRPAREHWTELWDDLEPLLQRARAGETVVARDRPFQIRRRGYLETVYFDISYSPARGAQGETEGVVCIVDETTERVVTEQRLREANERIQLALNSGAIIGTWVLDVPAQVLNADALFARSFGLDERAIAEGVAFDSAFETIHPDDRARVRELKLAATRSPEPYRAEYRVRQRDGSYRWVEANGRCEFDEAGRPRRFPGVLIDIHERKLTEEALRASEARFRTMSDAMPGFAWTADAQGMLDHVSQQWLDYSGSTPEQSLGAGWASFVHPGDVERAGIAWRRSVESGEPYDIEFRLRRRDGVYRSFLARALPVRGDDGSVTRWVGTCNDIDDTVAAREVLARSRADLERKVGEATRERNTIWNTTPNLVCILDRNGRIRTCNPAWTAVLGWSEAEVRAMSIADFGHPHDVAGGGGRPGLVGHDRPVETELRFRHRDGSYRWIAWSATPDGDSIYAIGRDTTAEREQAEALRNAEEQLRQAQKMEAVGQLTGGIAHDFNNLLTGIIGSLDLIKRRTAAGRTQDNERFIDAAIASANRAASLTQRLLAFSRRQSLDLKPVDLNRLLSSMEDLLRRSLGEQIQLAFRLDAGAGVVVGDPIQIETAVLNLAINARDAMPDGGTLTIGTSNARHDDARIAREGLAPGEYAVLSVDDTGTGMAQDVVDRAFDPFFTTKPLGQGTGLGLSMIYGYAKQSRGSVQIDSRVGRGTTVRLVLPCHAGAAEAEETDAPAEAAASEKGEVVLVVEDDPAVRMTVIEVLRELGYRTLEAVDGRAAVPILESRRHLDLLVTDVGLPGLNGRQVADLARQHRPGLKVLFITGYAENAAIRSGFLEPGMELITKPFALDDLGARVRAMMERR